jgi:phosphatidylserine decarboxylase
MTRLKDLSDFVVDAGPRLGLAQEGWGRTAVFLAAGGIIAQLGQRLEKQAKNGPGRGAGVLLDLGGRALLGLGLFTAFLYRDPERDPVGTDPDFVYAPADGKIVELEQNVTEPRFINGPAHRITIASYLWNVHIQRAPVAGQVRYVYYESGEGKEPAHYLGIISVGAQSERRVLLVQQPDRVARFRLPEALVENAPGTLRIAAGDRIEVSEKIGLTGFGQPALISLYLPATSEVDILCSNGQPTQAGMTVLARFKPI